MLHVSCGVWAKVWDTPSRQNPSSLPKSQKEFQVVLSTYSTYDGPMLMVSLVASCFFQGGTLTTPWHLGEVEPRLEPSTPEMLQSMIPGAGIVIVVNLYIYVYVYIYVILYIYTYSFRYIHIYILYNNMYMINMTNILLYINMYIYIYLYTYMYIYIYTYMCTYIYIYIHIHVYIYIYIYMYVLYIIYCIDEFLFVARRVWFMFSGCALNKYNGESGMDSS